MDELFLQAAATIGRSITEQALWDGGSCTWEVVESDPSDPTVPRERRVLAAADVYNGTAGIALFLLELHRHAPDPRLAATAEGAVRHALGHRYTLARGCGFHSGAVGVAYAAACAAQVLRKEEYRAAAAEVLDAYCRGQEHLDDGLDVIGGAAGAIPALYRMETLLGVPGCGEIAGRLAERLIQAAHREPHGWSWPAGVSAVRHLAGLGHGAAGIGAGLLEAYAATGEPRYAYAAEQAFLYERQFFDARTGNWPDFRHLSELHVLAGSGRADEARERLRLGLVAPFRPGYPTAWCHGAPGIGLSRLRAYALFGTALYRDEARAALGTTHASLAALDNISLCHGLAGNCDTLLNASAVLGEPGHRQAAASAALGAWERFGRDGCWPSGSLGRGPTPSLMLGEAGMGYFYLRLHDPAVPSLLLLSVPSDRTERPGAGFAELQRDYVDRFFGQTLAVVRRLGVELPGPSAAPPYREPRPRSDVEEVADGLRHALRTMEGPAGEALRDAARVEWYRFELTCGIDDFTTGFREELLRLPADEVAWNEGTFQLSPWARLIRTERDWTAWLERPGDPGAPDPAPCAFLLHRAGNQVHVARLPAFPAMLLLSLCEPRSLAEVVAELCRELDAAPDAEPVVRQRALAQLREAYSAGVVRLAEESPAAAAPPHSRAGAWHA